MARPPATCAIAMSKGADVISPCGGGQARCRLDMNWELSAFAETAADDRPPPTALFASAPGMQPAGHRAGVGTIVAHAHAWTIAAASGNARAKAWWHGDAGDAWAPDGLAGLDQRLRAIEQRPEIRIAARQKVAMPMVQVTRCNKAWQATASHAPSGADAGQHGLVSVFAPLRARRKGLGSMRAGRTVWCAKVGRHADASAHRIAAWMTGVSWHLAGNLEWVPDCTQVRFDGAAAVGTGREKEKTLFSRLQVSCRTWRKR